MSDSLSPPAEGNDWRRHLLDTGEQIRALLDRTRRVAVLGIKPESRADRPAYYVPEYVQSAGLEVVPVPVYYPDVTEILGRPVYRRLADVPGPIDLVDVFRRPEHLPQHVDDFLAAKPAAVWFQSGIRHDAVAERVARAGIDVVQDRCLMVELRRLGR
jgi:predicted CoA-binding protein